jgi:hypothetical protein
MSYSLTVRGRNVACALAAAAAAFDKVVEHQPVHNLDRDAALANASNVANVLNAQAEDEQVIVSMHGSVSVNAGDGTKPSRLHNCNASASVFYVPVTNVEYNKAPDCAALGVPEPA